MEALEELRKQILKLIEDCEKEVRYTWISGPEGGLSISGVDEMFCCKKAAGLIKQAVSLPEMYNIMDEWLPNVKVTATL